MSIAGAIDRAERYHAPLVAEEESGHVETSMWQHRASRCDSAGMFSSCIWSYRQNRSM